MARSRKREGIRVCRAAWLIGISVREYREIEAGDRTPNLDTYRRISELYGWPQVVHVGPCGQPLLRDIASDR
jgi:DNA-binding XRE family transcriptional regulator